jgi:molecular chaperone GrpE
MSDDKHVRDSEATEAESDTANAPAESGEEMDSNNLDLEEGSGATSVDVPAPESYDTDDPESLRQRIAELETEVGDLTDSLLRKTADFDNYRKRMLREKEEFVTYANRELLLDIVAIIDDFERAIKSADESPDFSAFHDGIVMIEKQFTGMLERKWKLSRFDSAGEEFDPQKHEAMMTEDRSDHDVSTVLEDFQKGYMLHEKVLRPAKVKVSMPAGGQNE